VKEEGGKTHNKSVSHSSAVVEHLYFTLWEVKGKVVVGSRWASPC
jgi:hypothetical protein